MYRKTLNIDGTESTTIFRVADSAFIPADRDNRDYQQYVAWLDEGNEPEEWSDGN